MASQTKEIAPDVYRLSIRGSSVYFVRSGPSWALIDTAWAGSTQKIKRVAEALFGEHARPAAILLTHSHPDHSGSALELARMWDVPVYAHPDELPPATGDMAAFDAYLETHPAGPLDRWVILPLMRIMPARAREAMRAQSEAFAHVARALEPDARVPGLPDWDYIPTPGHSPGHVAFFRQSDRVLIAGDALLTININSIWDLLRVKRRVSGPPYISTWNWQAAKKSASILAGLEPRVLACGHGAPITDAAAEVRSFADAFAGARPTKEASGAGKTASLGSSLADRFLFALSAAGVPIGIFALRRLGRLGGLLLDVAAGALGVRALVMLATGTAQRLRAVPRLLLFAETALDWLATTAGFWAWVWRPFVRPLPVGRTRAGATRRRWVRVRSPAKESGTASVTALAIAMWMAALVVHTARMAIYISPSHGLRKDATTKRV
ncbi:MAG: MBL fold metallo-hydrolase [Ktedonobacterales bacterium]